MLDSILAITTLTLGDSDKLAIFGGVAVVAIVAGTGASVLNRRSKERSRREIAAYIAEGSMTPEQGATLMRAGDEDDE